MSSHRKSESVQCKSLNQFEVRNSVFQGKNKAAICCKGKWQRVPHRGLRTTSFPKVLFAVMFAIEVVYQGRTLPPRAVTGGTAAKCTRNEEIRSRHAEGERVCRLAEVFGISEQRVSQIVQGKRR